MDVTEEILKRTDGRAKGFVQRESEEFGLAITNNDLRFGWLADLSKSIRPRADFGGEADPHSTGQNSGPGILPGNDIHF